MLALLYIGNTHYVELTGLQDPISEDYLDDTATVTATIYNQSGTAVTNGSCTLTYTAASDGDFVGYLSYLADVSVHKNYKVRILVVDGVGKRARWDIPANTVYRDEA